eukprot:CAMPEP_0117651296 /NCGR_PEP_ID=MMETSP0804-20121206/2015_1 /TAXON_ID=1074897 /ORGANISM="Tetraselmis astigmatica, Strain CCMP880" /LENGTH=368 /DNA_ID=CAMNT_0005457261 /DNA_START=591 /DNA_END=1697 /DNA_ORIENTATION=+
MADNLARLPLAVGILGPGLIGQTLLRQLAAQAPKLMTDYKLDLQVVSIANSRQMLLSDDNAIDMNQWANEFQTKAVPMNLNDFIKHLCSSAAPHRVVVDCSSSEELAKSYIGFMENGCHIVTPNKKMGSGPLADYLTLRALSSRNRLHWFYEATCGAGLPVVSTLKTLTQTGDRILRIEGILSGTLSYIFNTFGPGLPFSQVVQTAKAKGYTEPDPRDDMSGTDVARKIVLLAREAGSHVELEDVSVLNLVPEGLRGAASAKEFLDGLPAYDDEMERRASEAAANGEVLRYVAVMDGKTSKCRVELRNYLRTHPFAHLEGSDNIIMFTTDRYYDQPLIIRGPGAGAEVTAAGVFGDILKLAECLGKPT